LPVVSASAVVGATAEEVFDFLADYRNIPRLQPHFTSASVLGGLERGMGAEVALEGRFHGVPMNVRNRIVAFTPPVRLVSVSDGAVLSRSTWELGQLTGNPPTTHVTLTIEYSLRNVMGGLFQGMGSALWPFFHREIQGMTNESLRRLHSLFEVK